MLYKAWRYDVKGKQHLKSLEKYYVVDTGLRTLLLGKKKSDIGHILENIVYLELIRRGYSVSIGKVGELEIDFIAEKSGSKVYYQVSASVLDPVTFEREIKPLPRIITPSLSSQWTIFLRITRECSRSTLLIFCLRMRNM